MESFNIKILSLLILMVFLEYLSVIFNATPERA